MNILEFVFTVGHIEVYKEKKQEAYYWKFFDEDKFHGAFLSLQTCMSNYENVILSEAGMREALATAERELKPIIPACPVVIQSLQTLTPNYENVIFVNFRERKKISVTKTTTKL